MRKERIFWGVFLLLSGVALIIGKLGYFEEVNLFTLAATIFLVAMFLKSAAYKSFSGVLFSLAFLGILYDDQLGITALTPWTLLFAALLGSIGLSLIFGKKKSWKKEKYKYDSSEYTIIDVEDEGHIKLDTSFSGSVKYINTDRFEQADISASFGSSKIYFDNATLKDGKGILRLQVSFAGVELYIPKTWTVEDRTNIAFGAIDEKNKNYGTSENVLTIVGSIDFAGVEIIYV